MSERNARAATLAGSAWTWSRLARLAGLMLLMFAVADLALAPLERRMEEEAWSGQLQNAPGLGIADATRFMLLGTSALRRETAVAVVGSSVTFGPGLAPGETLPAQLASWLAAAGHPRPVFNCAQPGGDPRTAVPVAAALGTHPVSLLLVEVLLPYYAEHKPAPVPPLSSDDIVLLEAASPAQREILARAGIHPTASERIEAAMGSQVRSTWRLYRLRGSVWWDPAFTPTYLIWSLRRELATSGLLPKRFHGQSTNVGRLPWREAYVGDQRPGVNQRFDFPSDRLSSDDYSELRLTAELARSAGVPVVFFELPLNLAFQRAFHLMSEDDYAHLDQLRSSLAERMEREGLDMIPAPTLPDDGFLDRAHLTPLGARILAKHLGEAVLQRLSGQEALDPPGQR